MNLFSFFFLNEIVFLIFLSATLLLVYGKATDFCILVLYCVTSLNSFILIVFWWESLGFSMYSILSPVNSDHLTSYQMDAFYFFLLSDCYD